MKKNHRFAFNPLIFISDLMDARYTTAGQGVEEAIKQIHEKPVTLWEMNTEAKDRFESSFMCLPPIALEFLWSSMFIDEVNEADPKDATAHLLDDTDMYDAVLIALNEKFKCFKPIDVYPYGLMRIGLSDLCLHINFKNLSENDYKTNMIQFWETVEKVIISKIEATLEDEG